MKVFVVMATLMALLLTASAAENNKSQASTDQAIKSNVSPSSDPKKLARFEQDKKEVTSFLNAKNIVKTIVKLVFGSSEESTATSRQVLNLVVKVLDMLKTSFGQNRARSSTSGRGIRDAFDDAALAGVSMMKGYIKSYLAKDTENNVCANRFMCEAARDAVRDGREMGFLVAQFGGFASTYVLENPRSTSSMNSSYDAARRGRSGEDCAKIYSMCSDPNDTSY